MRGSRIRGLVAGLGWALLVAPASAADEEWALRFSVTPILQYESVDSPEDDDGVAGYFDRYRFVPNKSTAFPLQLGVRALELDALGESDTPLLQIRLASPSANLGLSGSDASEPFLAQRGLALGRLDAFAFDLDYWRMRTENLRFFPNTSVGGRTFDDRTRSDERFQRDRTGFRSEVRTDLGELLDSGPWMPTVAVRGGYETREGRRPLRFLLDPTNDWLGLAPKADQEIGEAGTGILLSPFGGATLALDFDYESFRENHDPLLRRALGGSTPPTQTIGFVPDTDRLDGTLQLRARVGDRAVVEAGAHVSYLEQVDSFTPLERGADLDRNRLLFATAKLAGDVEVYGPFSLNAFARFEQRENDLQRNTALFRVDNGTQVDAFMHRWQRVQAAVEGVARLGAGRLVALGSRFELVERDLDFAQGGLGNLRIVPANALVADRSEAYTVYARSTLRLLKRIHVSGELGYRFMPETGYATELDENVYGRVRASYVVPTEMPIVLSLFARGGSGENDDFTFVSGVGDQPQGSKTRRRFERTEWLWGLTGSVSPTKETSVFSSLVMSRDAQDYDLVLSSLQRYVQPVVPVSFTRAGNEDYRNQQLSLVLGTHNRIQKRTEVSVSYSFTWAQTEYSGGGSPALALASRYREIDADIHGVDLEVGHELRSGLRLMAGYGYRHYEDGSRSQASAGSSARPFDLTTDRHIVTLGVTLTSDLLKPDDE